MSNEVYEVCQRLAAAGFPQDSTEWRCYYNPDTGQEGLIADVDDYPACPNASECMKFARERWPDMRRFIDSSSDLGGTIDGYAALVNGHIWCHADPDQAARLALAAALEADNAK